MQKTLLGVERSSGSKYVMSYKAVYVHVCIKAKILEVAN